MARPTTTHPVRLLRTQNVPEIVPQDMEFFTPPKGMNTLARLSKIPRQFSPFIDNLILDRGKLKSRLAVVTLGGQAADPILQSIDFTDSSGAHTPVRFTTTSFQYHDGLDWRTVSGDAITGSESDYFGYTSWNNKLLFDNGLSGLHEFDPSTRTLRIISAAPKSQHLTTFGGRIIASSVRDPTEYRPYRIRWSVKNNSEDWTGLGSGFEDLLSTPGGRADSVIGVYPITDEIAIVIRTNTVWQMTLTGIVDAPFRFSLIYDNIGSNSRQSVRTIPDGVIFLGNDDVYIITRSGVQRIGEPIRNQLIIDVKALPEAYGEYDPFGLKYLLGTKESAGSFIRNVWEYSFIDQGWSRRSYPFDIRSFAPVRFTLGTAIDDLTGTIDSLTGVIDDLGVTSRVDGFMFTMAGTGRYTVNEQTASDRDVDNAGVVTADTMEIRTGVVHVDDSLHRVTLVEAQIEYELASGGFDLHSLLFEYSADSGATWVLLSSKLLTPTVQPAIWRISKSITARDIMFRLRSSTNGNALGVGRFTLISMHLFVTKGAMLFP